MRTPSRWFATIACGIALTATVVGCSSSGTTTDEATGPADGGSSQATTLTIYSGQHKELVESLAKAFTEKTGIKIELRDGEDPDIANQILEEGDRTKADLYLSEDPGYIGRLADKDMLAKVPDADFDDIDPRLVPSTKTWVPYAARARVIYYDPEQISVDDLPNSIMDLTKPEWKGRFAYSSSDGFPATVSYLIDTIGEEKTLAWLKGIEENGVNEHHNGKVRDTVEAGQHEFGLANHYYWWRLAQTKGGADKLNSKLYFFDHPDAGGLLLASGAGVLKASDHQDEAKKFLSWLVSPEGGQKIVGGPDADNDGAQFPVDKGAKSSIEGLPSLDSIVAPKADQTIFADPQQASELIEQAGIS